MSFKHLVLWKIQNGFQSTRRQRRVYEKQLKNLYQVTLSFNLPEGREGFMRFNPTEEIFKPDWGFNLPEGREGFMRQSNTR